MIDPTDDPQLPFLFWPNGNPNLGKLGIFTFTLTATNLQTAITHVKLDKRQSPSLSISLANATLSFCARTHDDGFRVVASTTLECDSLQATPIYFDVPASSLIDLSPHLAGKVDCTYDRLSKKLQVKNGSSSICLIAREAARFEAPTNFPLVGQLKREALYALRYAGRFKGRRSTDPRQVGVKVSNGVAIGGYTYAVSRCKSAGLDPAVDFSLTNSDFDNLTSALSKLGPTMDVFKTDTGHGLVSKDRQVTMTWRDRSDPLVMPDTQPLHLSAVLVPNEQTYLWLGLLSGFTEKVDIEVKEQAGGLKFIMSCNAMGYPWSIAVEALPIDGVDSIHPEPWKFCVKAKDLADAIRANATEATQIGFTKRAMTVAPGSGLGTMITLIAGFERE